MVPSEKIYAGIQIIAYDWDIPYVTGYSRVNSLSVSSAIELARNVGAVIEFDELSQTPYFEYIKEEGAYSKQHIVWFIDARTIDSMGNLVVENNFKGPSVWNIMDYYPQLWLVLNTQYDFVKLI